MFFRMDAGDQGRVVRPGDRWCGRNQSFCPGPLLCKVTDNRYSDLFVPQCRCWKTVNTDDHPKGFIVIYLPWEGVSLGVLFTGAFLLCFEERRGGRVCSLWERYRAG